MLDAMLCLNEHELQSMLYSFVRGLKATMSGMLSIPFPSSERLLKFNKRDKEKKKINVEQKKGLELH